ncbi:MAG: hypothetical protein R3C49_00470 [Planctomycetaceae bacterium]
MNHWLLLVVLIFGTVSGCGSSVEEASERYVHCRTLDGDRTAIRIFEWEFNAVADAIRSSCPVDRELAVSQIEKQVTQTMPQELRESLESPRESVRRVLLELEVRGEFIRNPEEASPDDRKLKRVAMPNAE